jgi:hypothetical protein
MKRIVYVILLLGVMGQAVFTQGISLYGYGRSYWGGFMQHDGEYSILQNTLDLRFDRRGAKASLYANPVVYHYPDQDLDILLRQAYLDLHFGSMDIRLGKQQIIWGKADGVFITDILSPKDLREFLLPDFEEIRIGINALKMSYYRGNSTYEFVWMPVFQKGLMPSDTSRWAPSKPDFLQGAEYDYSNAEVEKKLDNSQFAFRYSMLSSVIDVELVTAYVWDELPTNHIYRSFDPETSQPTGLIVRPEHHRLGIFGGSFSTTKGGFVIRGEGAYYTGKHFNTTEPAHVGGTVRRDYLHYLAGVEYSLWGATVGGQLIQESILNYDNYIIQDRFRNTATFLISKNYRRETVNVELFTYYGIDNNDALIRPKISYDFADGFEILAGANIFFGDASGYFGQFGKNDMIYAKVKYNF